MKKHIKGSIVFGAILLVAFMIGNLMMQSAFFGAVTLLGIVLVVESVSWLKWILMRTSKTVDLIILVATIVATASLGITVVGALTLAGIGYSLIYAPYLRSQYKPNPSKR